MVDPVAVRKGHAGKGGTREEPTQCQLTTRRRLPNCPRSCIWRCLRSGSPSRRRRLRRSPAFDAPMPESMPDGRTGKVPAGCVFWMKATDRSFTTAPEDHANCSVGSLTHGLLSLQEAAGRADVADAARFRVGHRGHVSRHTHGLEASEVHHLRTPVRGRGEARRRARPREPQAAHR